MYFICKVICKCISGFWLWRGGHADLTLRGSVEPAASLGASSWSLNTFVKSRRIHHALLLTGCLLLLLSSFPNIYFTYLAALSLSCDLWDLFPWPEIKPGPPVLGARSLGHWPTRKSLYLPFSWRISLTLAKAPGCFGGILFFTPGWGHSNVSNAHAEIFQLWKFKHDCFMGIL